MTADALGPAFDLPSPVVDVDATDLRASAKTPDLYDGCGAARDLNRLRPEEKPRCGLTHALDFEEAPLRRPTP